LSFVHFVYLLRFEHSYEVFRPSSEATCAPGMEIVDIYASVRCQQVAIAADDIPGIQMCECGCRGAVSTYSAPPTVMGQAMKRFDRAAFFYLHEHSPSGLFSDWNPRVKCRLAGA
jgi:hypothetical protein